MNLLKASFLLAAAATATQLDATDYRVEWSSGSAKMTAILSVDLTLVSSRNQFTSTGPGTWLTAVKITGTDGVISTGPFTTLNDYRHGSLNASQPIFLSRALTSSEFSNFDLDFHWGNSGGSFNFHTYETEVDESPFGSPLNMSYFGPNGVSDIPVWLSSINDQNRIYTNGSTLAGLPLEGAHHRPMMSFDRMGKESQAWATGDFGSSSRTRDVHVTSGEAGINWNIGKSFLFGVAGGHAVQNQDLAFGGSSATKGDFVIAELDYRPEGTQWIVSLLGMVGSWESKTNRGYTNGPSIDSSYGVTDTITRSARLRVDAPTLVTFGGFGFAPYASYTVTQTIVDAYTETGGGFPASFNEQDHNATEARLGVTASKDLSEKTKLLLSVEAIHRFDGVGPALTGQDVTGGVAFSLPGVAPRPDCVRLGFDVDHKLSADTLLNVSAHVSTVGEAHDVSAAISIRRAF